MATARRVPILLPRLALLVIASWLGGPVPAQVPGAGAETNLFIGSGAKAGEITDRSALVHFRLTSTAGQDAQGLIPGRPGQARVRFSQDQKLLAARQTEWATARPDADYSLQVPLTGLTPGKRHYYQIEYRADERGGAALSETYSFVTAPPPNQRAPVMFHLTTCQDIHGESTYVPMRDQSPDFCVSAGDTVYYDGQGQARNVLQAWQAYQKMFGLPAMKEYYRNVGGYFMKDDHDYRFNDSDPYMKGRWVTAKKSATKKDDPAARYTETKGDLKLDVAWLTHEEGVRVFKQVFPLGDKTYRTMRWGQGLQIWLLEHRDYRSPNEMPDGPDKSIWGQEQKAWLLESLKASDADFRVIISPNPIIGPDRLMKGDNHANLNGFWHEAQTFLDWIKDQKLNNVIVMCGDRHWQYHSTDRRNGRAIHEFSCGPTCDEHTQAVPPMYDGVERPYSASRGGFMSVRYRPDDRSLACDFFSVTGEPLYQKIVQP